MNCCAAAVPALATTSICTAPELEPGDGTRLASPLESDVTTSCDELSITGMACWPLFDSAPESMGGSASGRSTKDWKVTPASCTGFGAGDESVTRKTTGSNTCPTVTICPVPRTILSCRAESATTNMEKIWQGLFAGATQALT